VESWSRRLNQLRWSRPFLSQTSAATRPTRRNEATRPAARLAASFAAIANDVVESQGGKVLELRGDEALAVFGSPRQALKAALELHDRIADGSHSKDVGPFSIGIGIDAGEAVAVDTGFRGGALNTAARLCSLARPGETLCTEVVKHLARKIDGLSYVDLGEEQLKGIAEPVRIVEVQREGGQIVPAAPLPLRRRQPPTAVPFDYLAVGNDLGQAISDRIHSALATRLGEVADLISDPHPSQGDVQTGTQARHASCCVTHSPRISLCWSRW
jgi:hypothetical protein